VNDSPIAFYTGSPVIPLSEHDAWWGANGFTEWTNVTAARAPILPNILSPTFRADLASYDLRLS